VCSRDVARCDAKVGLVGLWLASRGQESIEYGIRGDSMSIVYLVLVFCLFIYVESFKGIQHSSLFCDVED
jgi:hypothetical protein